MINLLKTRRSVRKFSPIMVENHKVDLLLESMLLAPSGKNARPFEFIVVDERTILDALADSKASGAQFLRKTYQSIVVLSDQSKTDIWIEDGAIALTIGHLQAHAMGLGSCWIQIRERKRTDGSSSEAFVKELFDLPKDKRVIGILAFGYADEDKKAKRADWSDKITYNKY